LLNNNKQRTCQDCFTKINELKELIKIMEIFDLLPLNIIVYKNIAIVCKSWNKVSCYYQSFLKDMQCYLPDHNYTKKELSILKNNYSLFHGHSKWIVQIIINQVKLNLDTSDILQIIENKKHYNCLALNCTGQCNDVLQTEDVIICLYCNISDINIIKYIITLLDKSCSTELLCYITFIVYKLRHYKNKRSIVKLFVNFLLQRSTKNKNFCNLLFWELTQSIKDVEHQAFYVDIRKELVNSLDTETYTLFINGYDFTNNLIEIIKGPGDPKENISNHLEENTYTDDNGFYLPININKKFCGIQINRIKVIDSKTKPLILPCIYKEDNVTKTFDIMVKHEDIRKEHIIMNIIKLMDFFLIKDEGLDLNITTYNILPISNEYGYIEFVHNSATLYKIKEEYCFSIQNFIMENNPNITAHELRNNFTKSCAAYCVITYLLGIGDRHLDNIMITNNAYIFNIDFGYILGKDPKILAPEFRITSEMIDAMGGIQSKYYSDFKNYCGKAYNCLRKHTSLFFTQLSLLATLVPTTKYESDLSQSYIKDQIIGRFLPGENLENAELEFKHKILKNSNTYSGNIIDYFHKKYKKTQSSSISPINNTYDETLYQSALNTFDNLGSEIKKFIGKD